LAKSRSLTKDGSIIFFAGHHHAYFKTTLRKHNYYGLATTGVASTLAFDKGQFDHFVWVSMHDSSTKISNILLRGIWGENPAATYKKDSIVNE
jgi:hypothetical protein